MQEFSKQALYSWQAIAIRERGWCGAHQATATFGVHVNDPALRHRLVHDELTLTHRPMVDCSWVTRLCREQHVASLDVKRRVRSAVAGSVGHGEIVQRQCQFHDPA